jgi:mono/diheme cytochrome c family protein
LSEFEVPMLLPLRRVLLSFLAASVCVSCRVPSLDEPVAQESGEQLYQRHCASCHGENAQGNGPVAPFISAAVPDLTRIAQRRRGDFPEEEIFQIIDGQSARAAHGPRHMPVWGYDFFGPQGDDEFAHEQATERVERLVTYLGTLQRAK